MTDEFVKARAITVHGISASVGYQSNGSYAVTVNGIPCGSTCSPDEALKIVREKLLACGVPGTATIDLEHPDKWSLVDQDLFDPEEDRI